MLSRLLVSFSLFFSSGLASGQHYAFETSQKFHSHNIELKPLPMVFNMSGGLEGLGLGYEHFWSRNWSSFGDVTAIGMRFSDGKTTEMRRESRNDVLIHHSDLTSVVLGSRYYAATQDSSWYAGMALGLNDYRFRAFVDDKEVVGSGVAVIPRIETGYRWILDQGLSFRVGALAQLVGFQDYHLESITSQDARDRTEDKVKASTHGGLGIDIGLAYQF